MHDHQHDYCYQSVVRCEIVSFAFSCSLLSPFIIANKSVSSSLAIKFKVSTSGVAVPRSQFEIACLVTPIFSASCSCENPCFLRREIMLSASFCSCEAPPFLAAIFYLILYLQSINSACQSRKTSLHNIATPQIIFAQHCKPTRLHS